MEILQEILEKGNVYIGAWSEQLLVAGFGSEYANPAVTVSSDRGIDHLCMLLVGTVNSDQSLIDGANKKYLYPLSITNTSEIMGIFEKSYVKFSYPPDVKQYRASIKQILVPALPAIPGVYWRRAYGATITEALTNAIRTDPQLMK